MSNSRDKLWTKDFIFVALMNFIVILIFYLLMVSIAAFATKEYDATTSQAGLATGIYIVGTLIGRLMTGRVINKIGSKKIAIFGLALFAITMSFYFIHVGISMLFFSRLVNGFAAGVASTATSTIIAQIIPNARKSEGIGYFSMSTTLGTAIGPFLGLNLIKWTSFDRIFIFCIVLAVFALLIGFTIHAPKAVQQVVHTKEKQPKKRFDLKQYIEPNALPIALVTLLMSIGYAAILSFISFFAEERHLVTAASFFFLAYAIAILVTRVFSGRIMDTKGSNAVMVPCFILFAIGLATLSVTYSGILLIVVAVIIGAGYGNLQSGAQSIAIKVTPPARAGLATSTYFIALDAGLGFGPYLLGYLEPIIGFGQMYFYLAILVILSLIVYMLVHGRKEAQLIERANA